MDRKLRVPASTTAKRSGTVLLTAVELGWVPAGQVPDLMILVLAFVAPLELLSGIFAFLARDVGAATGLTLLGAAWTGTALLLLTGPPGGRSAALGVFLLTMAANMIALASGAMRTKPAFGALLPIGRRGQAKSSIEGNISHQIEQAEREAGVRRQL